MKFVVTMKDPDGVSYSLDDADTDEYTREQLRDILKRWFEYDEYLYVEIDTVENTCTVLKT